MKLSNWQANALIIFPESPYAEYITEDFNEYNDWNCTFIIEAPMGESLFASVQSITFEKKDDCPSYVKVRKYFVSFINGRNSLSQFL